MAVKVTENMADRAVPAVVQPRLVRAWLWLVPAHKGAAASTAFANAVRSFEIFPNLLFTRSQDPLEARLEAPIALSAIDRDCSLS